MKLPVVAIVGRPNVGKSSLLNCLAGRRVSIVEETPGVTRDRVSTLVFHEDVTMELVDTGGIGIVDRDDLEDHVEHQIQLAVGGANLILLVVDVREGVTPLDRDVAERLRERGREVPLILVANKVDSPRQESGVSEFYQLAMGEPVPVSAKEGLGRSELLEMMAQKVWPTGEVDVDSVMRLAVVGRRNVGKSTFVNGLAQEDRVIVSEVPGTTRDAVDVHFEKDDRRFVVIDTAGIQRKSRLKDSIEVYSQWRTEAAIRRAHVVLFLIDATEKITRSDKWLGNLIARHAKICVLVVNKWDLAREEAVTSQYGEYFTKTMPGLHYAPIVFTTALTGKNLQSAVDVAQGLYNRATRRVGTGELNRIVEAIKAHNSPRAKGTKVPKMYYATQVATTPPTFAFFVNRPELFSASYRRYVENALREALKFDELPISLHFRARPRYEKGEGPPTTRKESKSR